MIKNIRRDILNPYLNMVNTILFQREVMFFRKYKNGRWKSALGKEVIIILSKQKKNIS